MTFRRGKKDWLTISANEFAAVTGVDSILTESTQFSSKKMATTKKNENIITTSKHI